MSIGSNRLGSDVAAMRGARLVWVFVTALAAVVATALLVQYGVVDPFALPDPERRWIEARITGLSYAPHRVSRSDQPIANLTQRRGLQKLTLAVSRERTFSNLHRLGAATLASGKAREAFAFLEEAARNAPADPAALADLAAAELSLGRIADGAEHAARSLALDPEQSAAAFNWALSLEKLSNRPAALEAWKRYLTLDPDSGWSNEARRHLEELRFPRATYEADRALLRGGTDRVDIERLVHRYPQRARARGHNVLLPAWIEKGGVEDLAALRAIAEVRAEAGDPYLLDIANHAATHRMQLAGGIRAYVAGRDHERAGRWDDAAAQFASAAAMLREAGSPLSLGAEVYAASSDLSGGRAEAAFAKLASVDRALAAKDLRYPSLVAEAEWIRGLLLARSGASDGALDAYRSALAAARRAGEVEHEVAIAELVASRMASVAEPEEADRLRVDVLRRLDDIVAAPERMFTAYQEMAFTSLRAGRPYVALAFAVAASRIADESGDVAGQAMSAARRALALHQIGRREAALLVLKDARATAMQIPSEGARDRALAEIDFTTGGIEMPRNPAAARTAYASAVAIWERYGWRNHIAAGFLARGEAAIAARDPAAAERYFRDGIAQMEHDRARIGEPALRIAFFERSEALFDRLIAVLLDDGRIEDALSIVERKRARFLLDQIATDMPSAAPLAAADIVRRTKSGTAILEVTLLDRGVELWLIRDGRVTHGRSSATRAAIQDAASRHADSVRNGREADARRTGRWLFDQLVGPVAHQLAPEEKLVIVADGVLQSLPFATLTTPAGQYLIDRQPVVIAPSASIYLRESSSAGRDTLLAVAQPSPEGFAPLPDAQREASFIARNHPRGRLVRGEAVTPEEFLELAGSAGTVHYAGHAIANEERPSRSSLVFESPRGPLHLTAEMVGRSKLHGHPFVVLAACSTGRGKSRRSEGVDSLAAAFLQAGARGVAATLWDIEDAPSSRLFRTFHRHLGAGESPANALRITQRAFLHSQNPDDRSPTVWGSITLIAAN